MVLRNGIRVTLSVDRARVQTGGLVNAIVEVANLGPGPATWRSGGCGLLGDFTLIGPAVPQPPAGRDWPGAAHWAKWSATTGGVQLTGFQPPASIGNGIGVACTMELRFEDIPPGGSERVEAAWAAITSDGVPAPPGSYVAGFDFPFVGRGPAEGIAWDPDVEPIRAQVPIAVIGRPWAGVPSTLAIDQALADPRLAGWLATFGRFEFNGSTIVLDGDVWRYEIESQTGSARITISAIDGRVLEVSIVPA